MSCCRLSRVKGSNVEKTSRNQPKINDLLNENRTTSKNVIWRENEISIGNWCFFIDEDFLERKINNKITDLMKKEDNYKTTLKRVVFGMIFGFKYVKGTTEKDKQYSWDNALVESPLGPNLERGICVSSTWYKCEEDGNVAQIPKESSRYLNMKNYLGTVGPLSLKRNKIDVNVPELSRVLDVLLGRLF